MRTCSHGAVSRGIAHGLMAGFLWSAALLGLCVRPAGAQVSTAGGMVSARTATTQSVAAVPLENRSRYRPETFGQEAADAVSTELRDRLNLDVLPRADADMWLRNLGYKPPFSDQELVRLATELEVNMVVTGQVRSARLVQSREGRYGEVTLAILLFDRLAQAGSNGALITSRGPASTEASEETLITKALQQAAFDAVQQMRTRPTVTAMVLWSRDTTVFLNVGGRAGVQPGMELVAVRDGLRIGMVEVTEASPIGSYATIIQGPPLRTGDHLRGIYQLPEGPAEVSPQRLERKRKSTQNLVLLAAAILGVADMASTDRGLREGNTFQASNLANGVSIGYSAPPISPAVIVSWIPFSGTEKTRLVGYEFSRNGIVVNVIGGPALLAQNYFIDVATVSRTQATITIDVPSDATPQVSFSRVPSTSATTGITVANNTMSWIFDLGGLNTGPTYFYQVRPVVAYRFLLSTGLYEWRLARDTEVSTPAARLVAVAPPDQASVAIAATTATFTFYAPAGPDEAIVQIARDPNDTFPPSQTFSKLVPGIAPGKVSIPVNLATELKNLPGAKSTILWWRVGIHNRSDVTQPRPFPFQLVNDYGFVWNGLASKLPVTAAANVTAADRHRRDSERMGALGKRRDRARPGATRDRILRAD